MVLALREPACVAGRKSIVFGALIAAAVALSGCAHPDPGVFRPVLTPAISTSMHLRELPPPSARVTVAIYKYEDLTGQFREEPTVQTLSRAVTQGAASILINALHEAGNGRWFTVLDRNDLNSVLKERQIVSEMRRIYLNENKIQAKDLPPLKFAGIILDGGIIGYDTNTMTGGAGAQYLGIGGNGTYQQDTVTVTLRAVSIKSGEVLANVTVHKTIASVALQANVFRFVDPNSLLEAEAGITHNEPKQLAVQEAIQKAVFALIMEGTEAGIWHFADRTFGQKLVAHYLAEKYQGVTVPVPPMARPVTSSPAHIRPITAYELKQASDAASANTVVPRAPPSPSSREKPLGALPLPARFSSGSPPVRSPAATDAPPPPSPRERALGALPLPAQFQPYQVVKSETGKTGAALR